jgi:hypothetical protein
MPTQQRLWRDDGGNVIQNLPSDTFRLCGQSAPLAIAEPKTPVAELLTKNADFFAQIFDHLQLALIHPSGYRDQHKSEWLKARHLVIIYAIPNWRTKLALGCEIEYSVHTGSVTVLSLIRRILAVYRRPSPSRIAVSAFRWHIFGTVSWGNSLS